MQYTEEEINLMKGLEDLPKKHCKSCGKEFPVHRTFFLPEKRLPDGFENRCRMCRNGRYLAVGIGENPKNLPVIDRSITNTYTTIYDQYEYYLKENVIPYRAFVTDNHIELFKYAAKKDNIVELNKLDRDWFKDKRLYGILLSKYKGSIFQYINIAYPNMYKAWQLATVGRYYWKDDNNRIEALNWFIAKLLDDKVIESIEDIPITITGVHFSDYGLLHLLNYSYDYSVYKAINQVLPNMFYQWEYKQTPDGYWDNKDNRVNALNDFVEHRLKIDIIDIPKVLSYEFFDRGYIQSCVRFKGVIDKYYNLKVIDYINDCYPNMFNDNEFYYKNHYPTLDNIIVKSEPERMIHHILINNKLNVTYEDRKYRFYDRTYNSEYRPDWIIKHNDKIVLVEYYGMLDTNGMDFGYDYKYKKKHSFYNELVNSDNKYIYLPIYAEDTYKSVNGLVNRFNDIGIELVV